MRIQAILIGALLLLCTFLFLDRSCTSHKLNIARNGYENQKIATVGVQLKADEEKTRLLAVLDKKDKEIENYVKSINERDLEDVEQERALEELETEEVVLVDKDKIIVNLRLQVNNWRERFYSANETIKELGKPFFTFSPHGEKVLNYPRESVTWNLDQKYLLQVDVTNAWITKFNAEKTLRLSAEDLANRAIKEASRIRFGSKLKTGGIAVIGGILLYAILK